MLRAPRKRLAGGPADPSAPWLFDEHSNYGFGSWHPGVCHFVLGDGSVRALSVDVDVSTLGRLCNRHDGGQVAIGPRPSDAKDDH